MNRIRHWPDVALQSTEPAAQAGQQPSLRFSSHRNPPCALFAPHHYEPTYAYPMLVWLHGPGDDERQLRRIMPHVSLRNYVAAGPRGCDAPEEGGTGFRWQQSPDAIGSAERRVFDCIDQACAKYCVAPDRIFLGGYQCGGTMALRIGLRHPDCFAGVLSVGGSFPTTLAPLTCLSQIRRLPLFIAQGRDSQLYPLDVACQELRLFHAAALSVTLRQYPCGDELTTQMLRDVDAWIMERIHGVAPDATPCRAAVLPGEAN